MPEPSELCEDCPPVNYPTDATRCVPCPRRTTPFVGHNLHLEPNPLAPPRRVSGFVPPLEDDLLAALKGLQPFIEYVQEPETEFEIAGNALYTAITRAESGGGKSC